MKEIIVKNDLGIRVYINGIPNLQNIPTDIADSFLAALEIEISDFYASYDVKKPEKAET